MKYIVVDLEATCWKERSKGKPSEIIEIGAVAINESGQSLGEFSEFIKPKLNPLLSDFCTELTSITQDQVAEASEFPEVIARFWEWIGIADQPYFLCSWGFYDKSQFRKDCELHGLDTAWLKPHISVKHQYKDIFALKKGIGMARALERESFSLEGTHHRGIDDARNISKIFVKYMDRWNFT